MNLCDLKRTVGYGGQERKTLDDYNEERGNKRVNRMDRLR